MRTAPLLISLLLTTALAPDAHAQWVANGVPVCTAANAQQAVALADDGAGAILAWEDSRVQSGSYDLYAARILRSGVLDPDWPVGGAAIATLANSQQSAQVVGDGAGGAFIAWQDQRNGTSDYGVYLQHVRRDGTRAPGWPENGIAVSDTVRNQDAPQMVADGAGGVYVAWVDTRADAGNADLYARRIQADGSSAPGWPAGGLALCTAADLQNQPVVARDGSAGIVVAWLDRRSGDYDVYATRLTATGARPTGWGADGNIVSRTVGSDEQAVVVASDGAGGLFAAWTDYRNGPTGDLYMQRLAADGVATGAWPSDGLGLCVAAGQQLAPRVLADGSGGFFCVWEDYRGAGDVFAARVLGDGTLAAGWAVDGLPVCDAAGFQINPRLTSDGAGGFFAVWSDTRTSPTNWNLYVTRVDANGARHAGWTANGDVLCNIGGNQEAAVVQADGEGGTWAAWQDRRTANQFDIYASRVGPQFAVVAGVEPDAATHAFAAGPSPFRTHATLRLTLATALPVRVEVFDVHGRRVRPLADGPLAAGAHAWVWDGRDAAGEATATGLYLVRASGPGLRAESRLAHVR